MQKIKATGSVISIQITDGFWRLQKFHSGEIHSGEAISKVHLKSMDHD